MNIDATLSISFPSNGGVSIRIEDKSSSIQFIDATISHEEFSRALSSLQGRPFLECEVRELHNVGKKVVRESRSIVCTLKTYNKDELSDWLKVHGAEDGWIHSTYLGSHSSVSTNDAGETVLHYSVTKYVEVLS